MIKILNIYKYYQTKNILTNLNHEFEDNGISIIYGPNGSGKTTLLKIMAKIIEQDSGDISFPSKLIDQNHTGYVFQKPLMLKRSIWDNLLYIASIKERITKDHKNSCLHLLKDLYDNDIKKINSLLNTNVFKLSGGEQQMISLVRTLILKPKILFLDEPFAHLDDYRAEKLASFINHFSKSSKIIMVTHRLDLTKNVNSDILYLK